MDELLDVEDVARLLHRSPAGVYALRHRGGAPPAIRVGRRLLWRREDLDRWLDERREERAPERESER